MAGQSRQVPQVAGQSRQVPQVAGQIRQVPQVDGQIRQVPQVAGQIRQVPQVVGQIRQVPQVAGQIRQVPQVDGQSRQIPLLYFVFYVDVGDETARNLGEISLQLETSIHPGSQELEITVHGECCRCVCLRSEANCHIGVTEY